MRQLTEREDILLKRAFEESAYTIEQQEFLRASYLEWEAGPLADWQIAELALRADMLTPFVGQKVREEGHVLSHGLTEVGYDVCLSRSFRKYRESDKPLDPANFDPDKELIKFEADELILPAGDFVLGAAVESIKLPPFVTVEVKNKSTLARFALDAARDTIINPGSHGAITLEITNNNRRPIILRAGDGIATFCFAKTSAVVENGYQNGRYSGQPIAEGPSSCK